MSSAAARRPLPIPQGSSFDTAIGDSSIWPLVLVAAVTLCAQLAVLASRDVLILEWRPTDLASIALDYYRHGFDFLHPQVFWGGSGSGYVEMEFPLIPYAVACLYRVVGIHDWVAISLPMACGVGLAVVMTVFVRRFGGPVAGLVAGLFVAGSPTWLDMSSGLWPDAPPIFFGTVGIYLLWRWTQDQNRVRFALSAASTSLAILLKLTSMYVGLPLLFLFWIKYRQHWWRASAVWIFGVLVLAPVALWYVHAYQLFLQSHNTFGILASGYSKFATVGLLTSPRFYIRTFLRVIVGHTTPFGFVLVAGGILRGSHRDGDYLFHVWFAAVLMYFLIAAQGVNLGHYQYGLPIVPPSAALAGIGFVTIVRALTSWAAVPARALTTRTAIVALLVLLAVDDLGANYLYESRGTGFRELSLEKMRTGKAVASLTSPGSLILVVDADMDDLTPEQSMTPPEVFYFSDRRGWYRAMAWLTPDAIEDLRRQGAGYLVVSANHVRYFRTHYAALRDYCAGRFRTLVDNNDVGIVYQLTPGAAGTAER